MATFAQRYRDMSDYQLAQLAADLNALVPEAREALRAEIARRPPPAASRSAQDEKPISAKGPLDGLGGWLAWYCLGLFGGVYNEARLAVSLHGGVNSVMLAFSILCWGMEPGDRCKHGGARPVGAQDDPHPPYTRRPAGSGDRGRWGSTTGFLSSLGWNG
jgi:hypothetical protein